MTRLVWSFGCLKPRTNGLGVRMIRISSSMRNDHRGVKEITQTALSARLERALKAYRRAPTTSAANLRRSVNAWS